MSCSFWLRRKKAKAQKQKDTETAPKVVVEEPSVAAPEPKEPTVRQKKKAVVSNDNESAV